ncbi:hypothetical protein CPC735_033500 [Coccidioides posadasii C735 delta SOWgp]|uniref:DUF3237 domain-containing protein n=1 Tax=Coccidioides posadasii (strain C735) TaxID=222929 RepID=C5P5M4_COCP7|nr:hypothetical protein CPC735_033500 [Coccidioides posadasii C735 delta SOWgp]EER28014.1 hypothetical protein CPC735_033500 [Coccidioides posadasii C735 delta SOWgp]|eukprot:XP_003070159.1 hypothetical protein CPC735_033500 [Coccidioides posadasii C735 delta SOWgp]
MSGFPSLQPAFTLQVKIEPAASVGSASQQCGLLITPMVGGTVRSEPGFSPAFNGEFTGTGNDYIHVDPDGKRFRLNAHGLIRTDDGALVYLLYTGIVNVTPELNAIMSGQSESAVTPFGDAFTHLTFKARISAQSVGLHITILARR